MSDEVWQINFAINVTSPFAFMRELAPQMARVGGGAFVCTASRNAYRSSVNNAAYDASKAALLGLMRTAAGEFAAAGIRVNAVSPGVVSTAATPEIKRSFRDRERRAALGGARFLLLASTTNNASADI